MRAAVRRGRTDAADAPLDQTPPEELLGRTDHAGKTRGDRLGRLEAPQRVDLADVLLAARHDRTRQPVAHLEDAVEDRGRTHAEREVARARLHPPQLAVVRERHVPEHKAGDGHALPEPTAVAPERPGEEPER